MFIVTALLQVLVGLALAGVAAVLVSRPGLLRLRSGGRRTADWIVAGFLLFAALFTLVAARVPFFAFFSAVLDVLVALGLWFRLVRNGGAAWSVPVALIFASLLITGMQPFGLKVLLLPKADALPYEPALAVRTLKTYAPGQWFESVRVSPDGTLFLSVNHGDNYATGDKSHAQGQVIAHAADGVERIVFTLPMGSTSGVLALAPDGTVYLTGTGANLGIWRITPHGDASLMTRLPSGAWPNGLDFGPDGMLYSADSAMGVIWRIDPRSGVAERVIEDRILSARPFISLAPGANGIHFRGRELIVTVSDSTSVLSFPMLPDGRFGQARVLARGIPGDDFAVAQNGSLYITTHPYNTLVRLSPDGTRIVIADARQNIVGATDAAFGRTAQDADVLYIVTDGGAMQGGAGTRGALVAIKIRKN